VWVWVGVWVWVWVWVWWMCVTKAACLTVYDPPDTDSITMRDPIAEYSGTLPA
jgi:hypothetical protein